MNKGVDKIAKWCIIVGATLFILIALFASITVGSAGHDSGVRGSTILANFLMLTLLLLSNKFQKLREPVWTYLKWLTVISMFVVMIKIVIGTIEDFTEGEEWFSILFISIPLVLFFTTSLGLIKNENKTAR